MNDLYVECLVQRKASAIIHLAKMVCFMVGIACIVLNLMTGNLLLLLAAIVFIVGVYLCMLEADVEYEYLYIDREITIDKVIAKSKRKTKANFQIEKMEVLAPVNSWHLDAMKNRSFKELDYSDGEKAQTDNKYVMIYEGTTKVILSPDKAFLDAIKNVAPRKVFMD